MKIKYLLACVVVIQMTFNLASANAEKIDLRLHEAAGRGEALLVDKLLAQKVDPNILDSGAYPAFYHALDSGFESLGLRLLKVTSPQLKIGPGNDSVLLMVIQKNCVDCIKWVLSKDKAQVKILNSEGFSPLMMASRYSGLSTVKLLVEAGADFRQKNKQGKTALQIAEKAQNIEVVTYLESLELKSKAKK